MSVRNKRIGRESEVDFRTLLASGCKALGLLLEPAAMERLALYHEELIRWSRKINLVARGASKNEIIENHFLDSLLLLSQLGHGAHLLDVGTGAGFPGLVCKAARPDITLTLVEPRLKRVSFLKHIIRILQLDDVSVFADRIENEQLFPSSKVFSHITGRAVADVAGFLRMVARFVKADTEIICMKGPKWQQELAAAQDTIKRFNLAVVRDVRFKLPSSGAERVLLVFGGQRSGLPLAK